MHIHQSLRKFQHKQAQYPPLSFAQVTRYDATLGRIEEL